VEFHFRQAAQSFQRSRVNAEAAVNVKAHHLKRDRSAFAKGGEGEQEDGAVPSSGQAHTDPVTILNQLEPLDGSGDRLPEVLSHVMSLSIHHP
jgi:hypothetical protein